MIVAGVVDYNGRMNLKTGLLIALSLCFLCLMVGCATKSPPQPVEPPSDTQGSAFNSEVPIVLPTFTIPEPANINPGKLIGSVYISDRDHKFHRAGCANLALVNTPVPRQQATIQGYSACPVCNP